MSRKQEVVSDGEDMLRLYNVDEDSHADDSVEFNVEGEFMTINVEVEGSEQITTINKKGAQILYKWLKGALECFEE